MDTLISNVTVVTMNPRMDVLFGAYIAIKDGKILPPFVAISGLGESAAWDIMEGRQGKQFLSIEEFSAACPKVSKTHLQMLKDAGAFGDLPDTSQVSFF